MQIILHLLLNWLREFCEVQFKFMEHTPKMRRLPRQIEGFDDGFRIDIRFVHLYKIYCLERVPPHQKYNTNGRILMAWKYFIISAHLRASSQSRYRSCKFSNALRFYLFKSEPTYGSYRTHSILECTVVAWQLLLVAYRGLAGISLLSKKVVFAVYQAPMLLSVSQ